MNCIIHTFNSSILYKKTISVCILKKNASANLMSVFFVFLHALKILKINDRRIEETYLSYYITSEFVTGYEHLWTFPS